VIEPMTRPLRGDMKIPLNLGLRAIETR